jgi:hypothetical protein
LREKSKGEREEKSKGERKVTCGFREREKREKRRVREKSNLRL